MKVVIQRVTASQVVVEGDVIGRIGKGLNLLVGIAETDTDAELLWMGDILPALMLKHRARASQ
jgi:D-tyrosyl-tRNA(Tyr) deacylase